MDQSFPTTKMSVSNNVNNNRKRPLVIDPAVTVLSKQPIEDSSVAMAMENDANMFLPSTLSKKKRQEKQPEQANDLEFVGTPPARITSQRNVPAFLHKLYNMVDDPSTEHLVRWSQSGNSFLVNGHEEFAKTVLPRFYKHNTFSSFVRQLNMYDFHKIPSIQQNSQQSNDEIWEFSSPHFQRGKPELLVFVTRKRIRNNNNSSNQQQDKSQEKNDTHKANLASIVRDITNIKNHQSNITKDLVNLHRDNEIIWQETLLAREKHQMHQQVISKILQFLTAVFSNDANALADLSKEDIVQAQHITQGHEQNLLRNNDRQRFSEPSDSGVGSDSNSNTGYLASDSSNDMSQPSSFNSGSSSSNSASSSSNSGSSSGSGSEDDVKPKTQGKKHHGFTFKDNSPSSYSSSGSSNSNTTPNVQREKSLRPTVDVNKLDKPLPHSFDPTIINAKLEQILPNVVPMNLAVTNNRSAQDITNDIDQLQANVETLATQLGIDPTQYSDKIFSDFAGFSENHSNIISSASRMDKLKLFALAGETSPKLQNMYIPPYALIQNPPPYNFNAGPNMVDTNYQTASTYFRELLRTSKNKVPEGMLFPGNIPLPPRKEDNINPNMSHIQCHPNQVNPMFDINASNMIPDRSFMFHQQQPPHEQ